MRLQYFQPSSVLAPYVRHYYLFETDMDRGFEDTVFPSGEMEMIFNLGDGLWESVVGDKYVPTPAMELWGQITKPLAIRSKGRHVMLGIKLFTHSVAYFFNDDIERLNDQVSDLSDILGNPVKELYAKLLEATNITQRIELIDDFLIKKLVIGEKKSFRINKVGDILSSIKLNSGEGNLNGIAGKHGITPRYLHKLVYRHTGLSPISFNKIMRFQYSLQLMGKKDRSFTSIAYESGYFDQSHFIKDFKLFTGITPSAYMDNITPVNQLLQQ